MATSTIKRPMVTSFLGIDHYRQHIVDNRLTLTNDSIISTWVVNGICFLKIHAVELTNASNDNVVILDGLPPSRSTMRTQYIIQMSNGRYITISKYGGTQGEPDDKLFLSSFNTVAGEFIGELTMCYPIR